MKLSAMILMAAVAAAPLGFVGCDRASESHTKTTVDSDGSVKHTEEKTRVDSEGNKSTEKKVEVHTTDRP